MDSQEAYERRTFNEYSAEQEAAEARHEAIETLAGEIAAGIEAALKSGAEIKSRALPGMTHDAAQELACWAQEYDDSRLWLQRALFGAFTIEELRKHMAEGYAASFAEGEYEDRLDREEAEAADDRREERNFERGAR